MARKEKIINNQLSAMFARAIVVNFYDNKKVNWVFFVATLIKTIAIIKETKALVERSHGHDPLLLSQKHGFYGL